jgi:pyruvate/2-oxoacid:ferredoxin oxidoreductase alpha subunit
LETVEIPDQAKVDDFLPPFDPEYKLEPRKPQAFGGLGAPDEYFELRYNIQRSIEESKKLWKQTGREFGELWGREYGLVESYRADDAETLIVTSATIASTARVAVDNFRSRGEKVGLLRIRVFRPFPSEVVREVVGSVKRAVVIDRNISFGASGIFYQEVKAALYNSPEKPPIFGIITGIGGRDVTSTDIEEIVRMTQKMDKPQADIIFSGVKE